MEKIYIYMAVAAVVAFTVTAVLGFFIIPVLHRFKFGQTIREIGPAWHKKKQGTPTMGGIMFIIGICVAFTIVISLVYNFVAPETLLIRTKVIGGLLMAVSFGIVGFLDDYISIKKKRNLGLTEKQKLVFQFLIAAAYLASIHFSGGTSETFIPLIGTIDLGIFYYVLALLVIVGMVNAVNFADGVDGLCTMVTFVFAITFVVISVALSYVGNAILASCVIGACLGFLIWNINPAKVFMGDTGSLFLGGLVCALAFIVNMPILLLPVGIIYIAEILSVVLQVSYFKATKGKRLFKMSPIHHHFEMSGWGEMKICFVFSLVTAIGGAIAVMLVIL